MNAAAAAAAVCCADVKILACDGSCFHAACHLLLLQEAAAAFLIQKQRCPLHSLQQSWQQQWQQQLASCLHPSRQQLHCSINAAAAAAA
jgi:hypothetical protein